MTVDELIQRLQELSNERDVPWIGHIGYADISAYLDFPMVFVE